MKQYGSNNNSVRRKSGSLLWFYYEAIQIRIFLQGKMRKEKISYKNNSSTWSFSGIRNAAGSEVTLYNIRRSQMNSLKFLILYIGFHDTLHSQNMLEASLFNHWDLLMTLTYKKKYSTVNQMNSCQTSVTGKNVDWTECSVK